MRTVVCLSLYDDDDNDGDINDDNTIHSESFWPTKFSIYTYVLPLSSVSPLLLLL